MKIEEVFIKAKQQGYPAYAGDGDLVCNICGEPWDAFGIDHGDMTPEERKDFLNGNGCPCCKKEKKGGKER